MGSQHNEREREGLRPLNSEEEEINGGLTQLYDDGFFANSGELSSVFGRPGH